MAFFIVSVSDLLDHKSETKQENTTEERKPRPLPTAKKLMKNQLPEEKNVTKVVFQTPRRTPQEGAMASPHT
jgi:hypothetical protein